MTLSKLMCTTGLFCGLICGSLTSGGCLAMFYGDCPQGDLPLTVERGTYELDDTYDDSFVLKDLALHIDDTQATIEYERDGVRYRVIYHVLDG